MIEMPTLIAGARPRRHVARLTVCGGSDPRQTR